MSKVTIAQLTEKHKADMTDLHNALTEALKTVGAAEESASKERTARIVMERERDEARKTSNQLRLEFDGTAKELMRHIGMIDMLERLGTIPKQENKVDQPYSPPFDILR